MSRFSIVAVVFSLSASWALAQSSDTAGAKIHVILVANTDEERLGAVEAIKRWDTRLQAIKKHTGIEPGKKELFGKDCSVEAVRKVCRNLAVGPNDTILFYYNGHGFTFAKDKKSAGTAQLKYPALRLQSSSADAVENPGTGLKEEGLRLVDVFGELAEKKPRLLLVIGDCCDNVLKGAAPRISNSNLMVSSHAAAELVGDLKTTKSVARDNMVLFASMFHRVTDEKQIAKNYRRFYVEEKGYYIVSASQFGQRAKAWTETGPEFTRQMDFHLHLMETTQNMNGRPAQASWKLLFMGVCTSPLWDQDGQRQQGQWDMVAPDAVQKFLLRK